VDKPEINSSPGFWKCHMKGWFAQRMGECLSSFNYQPGSVSGKGGINSSSSGIAFKLNLTKKVALN
jgi:hypothetical protein